MRYLNGTGAENVLIQLKVEDQNGVIITQELLSFQDGVILYTVPPHPKTTEFIWLQVCSCIYACVYGLNIILYHRLK